VHEAVEFASIGGHGAPTVHEIVPFDEKAMGVTAR